MPSFASQGKLLFFRDCKEHEDSEELYATCRETWMSSVEMDWTGLTFSITLGKTALEKDGCRCWKGVLSRTGKLKCY